MKAKEMAEQRFGKWQVLGRDENRHEPKGRVFWIVRCECGTIASVRGDQLRFGASTACCFCSNRGSGSKRNIIRRGA